MGYTAKDYHRSNTCVQLEGQGVTPLVLSSAHQPTALWGKSPDTRTESVSAHAQKFGFTGGRPSGRNQDEDLAVSPRCEMAGPRSSLESSVANEFVIAQLC